MRPHNGHTIFPIEWWSKLLSCFLAHCKIWKVNLHLPISKHKKTLCEKIINSYQLTEQVCSLLVECWVKLPECTYKNYFHMKFGVVFNRAKMQTSQNMWGELPGEWLYQSIPLVSAIFSRIRGVFDQLHLYRGNDNGVLSQVVKWKGVVER